MPKELIASAPANPRDNSRLLVFDTTNEKISDEIFSHLADFLKPGDLLITNNSRVMPARLFGKKKTKGQVEILLLDQNGKYWNVLVGGKVNAGEIITFGCSLSCRIMEKFGKEAKVWFNSSGEKFWQRINKIGRVPIPPYIKNSQLSEPELKKEYQTVYAKNYGSAAAPTAGLHFTKKLIGELKSAGVQFASIDLRIGLGTFAPIDDENIKQKRLHSENYSIPYSTIRKILTAKKAGKRIIAVGTTTVRALESSVAEIFSNRKNISASTDIFIQPGDEFQIVDGLITNFHLPKSSLMILVAAFIQSKGNYKGQEKILELYNLAIKKKYRFYSFGDAMLII